MSFRAAPWARTGTGGVIAIAVTAVMLTGCGSSSADSTKVARNAPAVSSTTVVESATSGTDAVPHETGSESGSTSVHTPSETSLGDDGTASSGSGNANAPLEPTGLFLNTHELSLSGAAVPSAGRSVCKTTPGATCQISFVSTTGVAHSLPVRTADTDGIVSWDWTPAALGLGVGTYRVEIVAEQGGVAVKITDARDLTVVS